MALQLPSQDEYEYRSSLFGCVSSPSPFFSDTSAQHAYISLHTRFISQLGANLTFPPHPDPLAHTMILARVGVSFISTAQACSNAESEIPNFDFNGTVANVRGEWGELFGRITVDTEAVASEGVELFYSSVCFLDVYSGSIGC